MDEETLLALEGSIAKWEAIVAGTGKDFGSANCPLCKLFINNRTIEEAGVGTACQGCPVFAKTGLEGCAGSPYEAFDEAAQWGDVEGMRVAARHELEFLKALRPKPV